MYRPRFASADRHFWLLTASYLLLGAILCASLLSATGARIGASRWLWDDKTLEQVASVVSAGRMPIERLPAVGSLEMVRELGVDPQFKRNPAQALVLLAAAASGVLIAWPIVRALLL